MKRELPLVITALAGLVMIVEYFFEIPGTSIVAKEMQNWAIIVAAFALAVAAINLALIHARNISQKRPGWIHSVFLLASLIITTISGIFLGMDSGTYSFIFDNIITPCGAAFYAMACFHLFSAAYRAFRAKTPQAAALLITGVLVILGRAPIADMISSYLPSIADWIMQVPNLAGMRAITISAAVGMIGVSLRILVGIDRTHLGIGQE